jgi:hypothetical protein
MYLPCSIPGWVSHDPRADFQLVLGAVEYSESQAVAINSNFSTDFYKLRLLEFRDRDFNDNFVHYFLFFWDNGWVVEYGLGPT